MYLKKYKIKLINKRLGVNIMEKCTCEHHCHCHDAEENCKCGNCKEGTCNCKEGCECGCHNAKEDCVCGNCKTGECHCNHKVA